MRPQGRELRKAARTAPTDSRTKPDLSDATIEILEERVEKGKVVARFVDSQGWDVIEDLILTEGKVEELVAVSLKTGGEDDLKSIATAALKFGVVTRIINRFTLTIEMGEAASIALRKVTSVDEAAPQRKGRPQSDRKNLGSPR